MTIKELVESTLNESEGLCMDSEEDKKVLSDKLTDAFSAYTKLVLAYCHTYWNVDGD